MTAGTLDAADRVGAARPNDWFAFTLGAAAPVDIGLSGVTGASAPEVSLTDAAGTVLAYDFASASRDGSIVQSLAAGTYWVDIADASEAGTAFALSIELAALSAGSPDRSHTTQATARVLGVIDGATATASATLDSPIGVTDDTSFRITTASHISAKLSGLTASLGLTLLDASGAMLATTAGSVSSDATIEADLAAGSYTLQASGTGTAASADIAVRASALPVADGATDLGVLGVATIHSGWAGPVAARATYAVSLASAGSIDARLSGLLADATLAIEDSADAVVASAIGGPLGDASLIAPLPAGSYTVTVDAFGGGTAYTLTTGLSGGPLAAGAPDGFGHTADTATSLGVAPATPQTVTGTIAGESADDFFSFVLAAPSRLSLNLGGLSQSASLTVGDGAGATVASASGSASGDASIDASLPAGTYVIDVSAAGTSGYSLALSADVFGGAGGTNAGDATDLGALNIRVPPPPPPPPPPVSPPTVPPPPPIVRVVLSLSPGAFAGALDAIEGQASMHAIASISLVGGDAPAFALTAAQLGSDQDALGFIVSPFSVSVVDGGYRASQAAVTAGALGVRSGVSSIGFADGTLTFDASTRAASVVRLYQAALGRAPDPLGLNTWVASNRPLPDLAQAFLGSQEFASHYGAGLGDAAFVALLYQNVLGRAPDAYGDAHWLATLAAGASRATVLVGFSDSAENVAGTSALVRSGIFTVDAGAPPIARLYDTVLGRAPDAFGLQAWDQRLDSGAQTLQQIAAGFTASAEFQSVFGLLDDADFVSTLYVHSLHRAPDPEGLAAWTSRLGSGSMDRAGVVLGFSESAEHQGNTQASIINADPSRAGLVLA